MEDFVPKWETWKKLHQEVVELTKKGDDASRNSAYMVTYGKAREAFKEVEKSLNELFELNMRVAKETDAAFDKSSTRPWLRWIRWSSEIRPVPRNRPRPRRR